MGLLDEILKWEKTQTLSLQHYARPNNALMVRRRCIQ